MPYNYINDHRFPDWKPDERNEVYIKVKPYDKAYKEKLIPIPYKIYDSDTRAMKNLMQQVALTYSDAKISLITRFPKKGEGYISHMSIILEGRIEDLKELQTKLLK